MSDDIAALLGALSEPLVEELHQESSLMQRVYATEFIPRCNVVMDSEGYVEISLEVPGFSRDSLEVSVGNGTLTISGRTSERPPNGSLIRCERSGGSFHRRFRVSPNTQESDITAWHENGLLTIRVSPRTEHPTHRTAISLEKHSHSQHLFTVGDLQRANTSIEKHSLHQSPPVSVPGSHEHSSTPHSSSNSQDRSSSPTASGSNDRSSGSNRSPRSGSNDCSTGSNRSSSPTGSGSNQRSSSPTGSGQNDGSTGSSGSQDRSSSPTGSPSSLMSSEASSEHNNNGHKRSRRHYEASEASSSSSSAAVEKRRRRRDGGSSSGGSSRSVAHGSGGGGSRRSDAHGSGGGLQRNDALSRLAGGTPASSGSQ